ncbi:unnamed protein product [Microthlaspi erraticum]|uniref:MULE transposase domain-containing protein n=1 Tax=Microthlaspi erraticum TaxID=1685480 RepID=A0A6D2KJJ8_9BRAS|nr:unnamed protein product [Microthlaspi erraticum]
MERLGLIEGIVPRQIADSMRVMFGLSLNYTTSYKAMKFSQLFVRGSPEDGYANVPSYLRRLKQVNPGTITHLLCDKEDRFKYCFVVLEASTVGFQYLRRVTVVDGTHLTEKYGGILLVAAGQDANFQVFPLAYDVVVDAENNEAWGWFFEKLQTCFAPHPMGNMLLSSSTKYYEKGAKELMYLVKGAAYAHTLAEYNRCMDSLRAAHPELATSMELADPKLWSRVNFPGDSYNIKMTLADAGVHVSHYTCSTYFKDSLYVTYANPVYPEEEIDNQPKSEWCRPPILKNGPGRKKKSIWQSWLEMSRKKGKRDRKMNKVYSCSNCKQPGHTRSYCVSKPAEN